jgi:hypothetical protein
MKGKRCFHLLIAITRCCGRGELWVEEMTGKLEVGGTENRDRVDTKEGVVEFVLKIRLKLNEDRW